MKTSFIKSVAIFLAILALGCAGIYVYAETQPQDPNSKSKTHAGHRAEWRMKAMGEKLGLSEEQKASIKAIFAADANQLNAIRQDSSISQEQKREQIRAIWQKRINDVNGILTTEQQQKFAELKKQAHAKMRQRMKQRMAIVAKKLGLTDEQKSSIKAIFAADVNQIKAIHKDASLTQEQKKEQVKAIIQKGKEQINAVLTPEQQAQWAQMQKKHKAMGQQRMYRGHRQQQGRLPADSNS